MVPIDYEFGAPLPFGRTIKFDNITFQHITKDQFERKHNAECLDNYYNKLQEGSKKQFISFNVCKYLYYFKAKISADSVLSATNYASDAFNALTVCATIAENRGLYSHAEPYVRRKSRSILAPAGVMLVSAANRKCDPRWSFDIRTKPDQKLSFTQKKEKMDVFTMYKRICREKTPIGRRIRLFLFEFARALHETDFHVRQLGLWRCLEIATATGEQGNARREKEIIQILAKYSINNEKTWRQQGKIVLEIRNTFVHKGTQWEQLTWSSTDKYLNWTQEYVESALSILCWMRSNNIGKKSYGEIDHFFDLYSKPQDALRIANRLFCARKQA